MKTKKTYNLNYRPDSYRRPTSSDSLLLQPIKGKVRRKLAKEHVDKPNLDESKSESFLNTEKLSDQELVRRAQIHPEMLGGEFLPESADDEYEIARISLKSTTADVIEIRARYSNNNIHYSIIDEYPEYSPWRCVIKQSVAPLTMKNIIRIISSASRKGFYEKPGLVLPALDGNYEAGGTADSLRNFVAVESYYYPQLSAWFKDQTENWYLSIKQKERRAEIVESKHREKQKQLKSRLWQKTYRKAAPIPLDSFSDTILISDLSKKQIAGLAKWLETNLLIEQFYVRRRAVWINQSDIYVSWSYKGADKSIAISLSSVPSLKEFCRNNLGCRIVPSTKGTG